MKNKKLSLADLAKVPAIWAEPKIEEVVPVAEPPKPSIEDILREKPEIRFEVSTTRLDEEVKGLWILWAIYPKPVLLSQNGHRLKYYEGRPTLEVHWDKWTGHYKGWQRRVELKKLYPYNSVIAPSRKPESAPKDGTLQILGFYYKQETAIAAMESFDTSAMENIYQIYVRQNDGAPHSRSWDGGDSEYGYV